MKPSLEGLAELAELPSASGPLAKMLSSCGTRKVVGAPHQAKIEVRAAHSVGLIRHCMSV